MKVTLKRPYAPIEWIMFDVMHQWICLNELYKLMKRFFQISNSLSKFRPKTEKYSNEYRGVNIDQIAMCYISMDLSRQALQTNGKFFSNFGFIYIYIYFELTTIFKIIVAFYFKRDLNEISTAEYIIETRTRQNLETGRSLNNIQNQI